MHIKNNLKFLYAYAPAYVGTYALTYPKQYVYRYSLANDLLNSVLCIYFTFIVDGMQVDKIEYSLELKRPLAIRALRRSNIRKKITEYLYEINPNYSYTSEIAYHVGASPSNVIGALRGMGNRYKEDESLLSLNLIEEKKGGKNVRLYGITDFGKEIMSSMRSRR